MHFSLVTSPRQDDFSTPPTTRVGALQSQGAPVPSKDERPWVARKHPTTRPTSARQPLDKLDAVSHKRVK